MVKAAQPGQEEPRNPGSYEKRFLFMETYGNMTWRRAVWSCAKISNENSNAHLVWGDYWQPKTHVSVGHVSTELRFQQIWPIYLWLQQKSCETEFFWKASLWLWQSCLNELQRKTQEVSPQKWNRKEGFMWTLGNWNRQGFCLSDVTLHEQIILFTIH